ncbi:gp53-like domain-containing protein [Buttiauxella izardii]|uniref:gp53-like domain-containing protein n=1 Tax=Buttiauxella izardii TaxID=82991 RepID=UPI001ABF24A3|nr:hypothetical protein [Buttiauxella izardii]
MAHRIDTATAQKDKFGAGKNGFTRGNPQTGEQATALDDDYFDMIQEELIGIVEAANITPNKAKHDQLLTALKALFLDASLNGSDIADKAAFLSNLGLKAAASRDVGTGANQIPDMGSFTFSNATQGFKKDPTGAMEQWFSATIPIAPSATVNGTIDVLFPNPFPNKCYGVHVTYAGVSATRDGTPFVSGLPVDKFTCRLASTYLNSGLDVFVRAVGY